MSSAAADVKNEYLWSKGLACILPKVIRLYHQYRARPACPSVQFGQLQVFILISLKLITDSAKMEGGLSHLRNSAWYRLEVILERHAVITSSFSDLKPVVSCPTLLIVCWSFKLITYSDIHLFIALGFQILKKQRFNKDVFTLCLSDCLSAVYIRCKIFAKTNYNLLLLKLTLRRKCL